MVRVVNVVKRMDGVQGSRYLLELELKDVNGQLLRLSHYIYTLIRHSRERRQDLGFQRPKPQLVLCNPVGFRWNPAATVHFIVPGTSTFNHYLTSLQPLHSPTPFSLSFAVVLFVCWFLYRRLLFTKTFIIKAHRC